MKVYFVGAGPGAADLITLRGAKILAQAELVMYAGSLVSRDMLQHCSASAQIVDTASLNLDEQEALYVQAQERGSKCVVRLHSGDPAIYGATAEQMRRLEVRDIAYEIVPGVSSFTAAAAAIGAELTKPGVAQSIIITRSEGRASAMPEGEALRELAQHGTTLCLFLSGARLGQAVTDLLEHYAPETPVALVQKATWPEEKIWRGELGEVMHQVEPSDWLLTTMMLIGEALNPESGGESRLYHAGYSHRFRTAENGAKE